MEFWLRKSSLKNGQREIWYIISTEKSDCFSSIRVEELRLVSKTPYSKRHQIE
jgi:hypothetical protein